ncbi:MAG: hypothetical protein J6B89_05240 [Bacilli bacterium]|nr:hypothetical protein [Bacilli bacterium]
MRSRMDRYGNSSLDDVSSSRSKKNRDLYNSVGSNTRYTTFTDVRDANKIELDRNIKNYNTREGYQKVKDFYGYTREPEIKQELDEFNYWYQDRDNKVYDINSVIDEAKRNRKDSDELESKRKLKNDEYNILSNMDRKELEKYLEEKKNSTRPDREELKEIINTITSKTLCGEIDQETGVNLLSDLMATQVQDKVLPNNSEVVDNKTMTLDKNVDLREAARKLEEKIERDRAEGKSSKIFKDMDDEFYTRSMDLSDKDFDMDDELVRDLKPRVPIVIKVLLTLVLVALVGLLVFFVIKSF